MPTNVTELIPEQRVKQEKYSSLPAAQESWLCK